MIHNKFQSILPKNGQENGTEIWILAKKCIMEKTHLKFCYVYSNNASITQEMRFLHINGFILESCHMESSFVYIEMSKTQNSLKKIPPEIRPAPPPPAVCFALFESTVQFNQRRKAPIFRPVSVFGGIWRRFGGAAAYRFVRGSRAPSHWWHDGPSKQRTEYQEGWLTGFIVTRDHV